MKKKWLNRISYKPRLIDIVAVLIIIPVVFFVIFFFKRETHPIFIELTYQRQNWTDQSIPPEYWQLAEINIGDRVFNSWGQEIAVVTDVEKTLSYGGNREYFNLEIQLNALYDTRTQKYVLDGTPLLIGNELKLTFGKTQVTGQIKNIYQDPNQKYAQYQPAQARLHVKVEQVDPWQAEALTHFTARNSKNEIIAQVTEARIAAAEIVVETAAGGLVLAQDPVKKDVYLTVDLPRVLCRQDVCYFNYYNSLLVGGELWIDSDRTSLSAGKIMDVNITKN